MQAPKYLNKQNTKQSVFNPTPPLVPKYTKQLTTEEKIENQTTSYSNDIAIIKDDDGNCSIKQDLTNVGIAGVTAIQYFKCGESKFDKHFRQHMKAVTDKIKY